MLYRFIAVHREGVPALSSSTISFIPNTDRHIQKRNSRPEKIIMIGPCRVSVFRNLCMKGDKEIEIPKVVLEVRYKDKQGRWRGTHGMTIREIPKAILALQKAYDYLLAHPSSYDPLH